MRNPKPSVTAETPSGSMKNASSTDRSRRSATPWLRRVTITATVTPISSAIQVASTAVRNEVSSASVTGTSRAPRSPGVDRAR
jgi:hypothetical protein